MILYPIDIMNSSSPPPSFTISKIEFGLRFFPAAARIEWSQLLLIDPYLWLIPTMLQGQDWQEENSSSTRLNWLTRPAHCNNTVIDIITLFPCLSVKQLVLPKISYLRKMSSQSKNRNCTCASICLALRFVCVYWLFAGHWRFGGPHLADLWTLAHFTIIMTY